MSDIAAVLLLLALAVLAATVAALVSARHAARLRAQLRACESALADNRARLADARTSLGNALRQMRETEAMRPTPPAPLPPLTARYPTVQTWSDAP